MPCYAESTPTPKAHCEQQLEVVSAQCREVVKAADKAIEARKAELKIADLAIKQASTTLAAQSRVIEDQKRDLNAWYRNPWVIGALGLAAGALGATVVITAVH